MNKTDIINNALLNIGEEPITDIENSEEVSADICRRMYEPSRRVVFKSADWPFARSEAKLERLAINLHNEDETVSELSYNNKFPYIYAIPLDCMYIENLFLGKIRQKQENEYYPISKKHYKTIVSSKDWDLRYIHELKRNAIVCRFKDDVNAIYTTDIIDNSIYDDLFAEALSLYLSYKICVPITKSRENAINHLQIYNTFISEARTRLLNEVVNKTPNFIPDMIKARGGFYK